MKRRERIKMGEYDKIKESFDNRANRKKLKSYGEEDEDSEETEE